MLSTSVIVKPIVKHYMASLIGLLDKAESFCKENGIAEEELLNRRLANDMHPLIWQIQMVTEFTQRCTARMAMQPVPSVPFVETSFELLKDRVKFTIEAVEELDEQALNGSLQHQQIVPLSPENHLPLDGPVYFIHFFLPNFFFHITTIYSILRNAGLNIGKFDFLGEFPHNTLIN